MLYSLYFFQKIWTQSIHLLEFFLIWILICLGTYLIYRENHLHLTARNAAEVLIGFVMAFAGLLGFSMQTSYGLFFLSTGIIMLILLPDLKNSRIEIKSGLPSHLGLLSFLLAASYPLARFAFAPPLSDVAPIHYFVLPAMAVVSGVIAITDGFGARSWLYLSIFASALLLGLGALDQGCWMDAFMLIVPIVQLERLLLKRQGLGPRRLRPSLGRH